MRGTGLLVTLPKLSIAAKLYVIFALMAAITGALLVVAVTSARHHAALADEFESANAGTLHVAKVDGLIYAVVMESRGVYMSSDLKTFKVYADGILKFNEQIAKVVDDWKKSVRGDDAELFGQFVQRIAQFIAFRKELARLGTEVSAAAGREWGDNDANRSVRKAPNDDLEKLRDIYAKRATRVYAEIDSGISQTAVWLTLLAVVAVIDEIGALARSIALFQRAMRHNEELNQTVRNDAELRTQRQEQMSDEIARFSAEVERPSPNSTGFPTRCCRHRPDWPAWRTMLWPRRNGRPRPPRRPPPTCATSPPPPTNCPPR